MAAAVVVIGLGNIGSQLVGHVARMRGVSRMTLVDPGAYESKDLRGQRIDRGDVGRAKVDVQADRIRRVDPGLEIVPIRERVENVPLGRLRGSVLATGLDNWRARQAVNAAARRLGVPWLDAAVQAEGRLARVNVYAADAASPCLECGWSERDYELLELIRPCAPDVEAAPTNAPASLGALAAALEAIEIEKLLGGEEGVLEGRQVLLDARHHAHHVTSFRRNVSCRLADHGPWRIEQADFGAGDPTLGELVAVLAPGASSVEVFGARFVRADVCPDCARRVAALRVTSRGRPQPCRGCGAALVPSGFDTVDALDLDRLAEFERALPVRSVGIRDGDVVGLATPEGIRRFEVALARRDAGGNR
jgi:adenylyltransferase/sulfurtransferase